MTRRRSELHDVARQLAGEGVQVFPCWPLKKVPATTHGFTDASCNIGQVDRWWGSCPEFNIGIATGTSGLVVIDLDCGPISVEEVEGHPEVVWHDPDGFGSWARLLDSGRYTWPVTLEVGTPRGGLHMYFKAPVGTHIRNSAGRLGHGIDVRAEGGYVLVPPSVTEQGRYEKQNDTEPAKLPSWLKELLTATPARTELSIRLATASVSGSYGLAALEREVGRVAIAPAGTRNTTLNTAAFNLGQLIAAAVLDTATVVEHLLLAGQRAGLDQEETEATVTSGLTAGMRASRRVAS